MAENTAKSGIAVDIEEKEDKKHRKLSGPLGWLARLLCIGLPIYAFLFIMSLFTHAGIFIYTGTHNALFLAVVVAIIFLLVPASKSAPRTKVPWYDILLAVCGLAGTLYIAANFEELIIMGGVGVTPLEQILGLFTIITLLEAVRRTMGWSMIIVTLCFLIHAKFTYLFPGFLGGPRFSTARIMNYIYLSNQGIFGMVLNIASTIIISFMIFGAFLDKSGAGNTFMKLALALLGHVRGGAAKVAVLGSALFGTVTGSPVAEVGVIGSFTIPLMKRIGYSPTFAGAVEAAAACGGVIDPPVMGAVAFVMADFTGLGYGKIALAAVLPAVLYYLSLFFQLDLRAAATGLKGLPKAELPRVRDALKESWLLFIPIAVLITWMMILNEEPTKSVYISLGVMIFLNLLKRTNRLTFRTALQAVESAGRSMIDITPVCALAGIIVGSITLTGLGLKISSLLVTLSGGSLLMLGILAAVAIYIMGMGIAVMATYILMAVLVAPAMVNMGVPVIVAHFFIFYIGVSMFITPPYAPAAYVAASVAGANPMKVGYQAMRLAIVAYLVPFISLYRPALLWQGTVPEIIMATIASVIAVYALSVGFEGYCLIPLKWAERALWLAGGFLLFVPGVTTDALGLLLLVVGFVLQRARRKKQRLGFERATG